MMPKIPLEEQLQTSFLWLERYKGFTPLLISQNLAKAEKEIIKIIGEPNLNAKINAIMNEAFEPLEDSLDVDKAEVQELAYNATQNIMTAFTTIEAIKIQENTKKRLSSSRTLIQGHTLQNHLKHVNSTTTRKIQGMIAKGFDDGSGIQEITRNIRNTFGVLERNQLNTLTRTMLLEGIRDSQSEAFDYFEDEITLYWYDAVMDSRTTPRCFNLNGTSSKKKSDITKLLNFHYSCRSILGVKTDISEEFDQKLVQWDKKLVNHRDGTKSNKFSVDKVKKVSSTASSETAFKAFDVKFQKDYMGMSRYNLWKSGKVGFNELFSRTRNTFIPLSQLEKHL